MKIYNSLTRKIEEFIPNNPELVTLYTCGPTVYNYAHIGNLRTYIMEDILERSLKYLGYNVKRVMNITDVGHLTSDADTGEDKMVKGAKREGKKVLEIAKYYTDAFFLDFTKLNIIKPEIVIPATTEIDEYIKIIQRLLDKGVAYINEGNVYFDTSKLDNYYFLSNQREDDLLHGSRETVEEDINKKNKNDFVLWFTKSKFEDQELKWESPWGFGYPGWHIECSGISLKYLGEYLDIHCGGVDNKFPHHNNEIAQSESYIGHKWCNYWVHGEFLNDNTGKMAKSKGEFLTVSLLEEKGYNPLSYRYFCLGSHYRNQLIFSYESLDSAEKAYLKLKNKTLSLKNEGNIDQEQIKFYEDKFKEAIENDLNTSSMLTLVYEILKDNNLNDFTRKTIIESYDKVLGLNLFKEIEKKINIDEELVLLKIEERTIAKLNKDFTKADKIRDELLEMGIKLIDTKDGTTYE